MNPVPGIIERLSVAITTAINDDETHYKSPLRQRHIQRLSAMQDAQDALKDLESFGHHVVLQKYEWGDDE